MNMHYTFFYASVFGFFFNVSSSLKMKRRRPHELRNEIYVPSLIDFELKGKSLAWFPVHLKNSHIENLGKLRWKNHRKSRYVEEPRCLKTGQPKRIYNKEEDEDDPDAGDGGDNGEIAYDDYDYYENENSTSNADSIGYETSNAHSTQLETNIHTSKEITVSETAAGDSSTTVGDHPPIIEDIDIPSYYSTEGPLTDDTEEPTERRVPGKVRAQCRVRHHTYQNQKLEPTTQIRNTILGTAFSEYPTSTNIKVQTGTLNDEQLEQPSTTISTTEVILKYYTDDYDDAVKNQKLKSTTELKNTNVRTASSEYPAETSTYKVHTGTLHNEQSWQTSSSVSTTVKLKHDSDAVKNQKLESTTQLKNTNVGTASSEYPAETSTHKDHTRTLHNEQSWQTSSTVSTTVKLKHDSDDYDDVVKNQKLESTTELKNTNVGTASSEYPAETSTYKDHTGTLNNEQPWQTSSSISTATAKLKYYTDDYDDEVKKKQTNEIGIKSTNYPDRIDHTIDYSEHIDHINDNIISTTTEPPQSVIGNSNMYEEITKKKSTTDSTNIMITASKTNEWPETYHSETIPERFGMLSSLKDSNTPSDSGSVPNRKETIYTVDISTTGHYNSVSKINDFTEKRTDEWVTKPSEPGEDDCLGYITDNTIKQTKKSNRVIGDIDESLAVTRLRHIETPPYPKLPVDLRFPTCSGNGDCQLDDILSPSSAPQKTNENNNEQKTEKNFEKKKEKSRKNRKHCRRKSTYLTTEMSKTVPSHTTQRYVANQLPGKKKDAKVVVRIPLSLSDIPVVVVRDPQTQKLSLSLIGAEQDPVQPKPIYYKPVLYHQMFPPPFSYNNLYSPNIPPFSKIYPYEYLYGPNMGYRYDKANYIYPKRLRFYNNYRWVRDTYEDYEEDEEDDEKKSTNSKWEIYLTV